MPTTATHLWRPSAARVLRLDGFLPVPRGAWQAAPPPLAWPAKDPGDTLDYVLDCADAVLGDLGDGIATLDVAIAPNAAGDLSLSASGVDGERVVLWLAGGQAGTLYTVTMTIGTAAGRTIARSVMLPVLALAMASASVAATSLTDGSGNPITDQNGNPILIGSG